jgi:hypothetical protein
MPGIITPSYKSGFYSPKRGGIPMYPELWSGCVGAWAPSLGESGARLFDHSAYGNHGTLTNMDPSTDWVASDGKIALDCDGVDDYVSLDGTDKNFFMGTQTYSMAFWLFNRETDTADTPVFISIGRTLRPIGFVCRISGSQIQHRRDGVNHSVVADYLDKWSHFVGTFDGSAIKTYFNGAEIGSTAATASLAVASPTTWKIGASSAGTTNTTASFDDIRIYNRALSPSEIATLATRRGIAYETYRVPIVRGAGGGGGATYTATIALTTGGISSSVAAEFSAAATYTASATATVGGIESSASAEFDAPVYTATAVATTGSVAAAIASTFDAPVYTASVAATTSGVDVSIAASFAVDAFSASIAIETGSVASAASATFDAPVYTASASLTAGGTESSISATVTNPTYEASATCNIGGVDVVAASTFGTSTFTGSVSLVTAGIDSVISASFTPPSYSATILVTVGSVMVEASDVEAPQSNIAYYYYLMLG